MSTANLQQRVLEATHCYVATRGCGCAPAICADLGDVETSRSVARWIREGYAVERLEHAAAVKRFGWCSVHTPPKQEKLL